MAEVPQYNVLREEKKWQQYWESQNIYTFDPESKAPIYSVDTPPPTISGKMHLGHTFSYAQQDFVIRYHRMKGENVFYPFGTDNNGLPTERLVEKLKNVKSKKMKRTDFIKLCNETLDEIRPAFIQGWKDIGISSDFSLLYSTIDSHCIAISQKSFIDLYKEGREYQKEAPTIWCTSCQTAIAQVELEDIEQDSFFSDIIFKIQDNGKEIDLLIATTRPELLPSCVAIFVHPEDERYKNTIGKKAKVPVFNHLVEIKADVRVDMEKGTGAVMCCTFGDQADIEWYKAHNLPNIQSITEAGSMTEKAGKYAGLKVTEARKEIIGDLKRNNLLVKQTKIRHSVNVHERCQTPVEIVNTKQWFIKYLDIKDQLLDAGKQMKWYPDYMRVRYDNWIKGLQWDWCISRQRYFGVPFPVWYCKKCNAVILADEKQLPVDPLTDKPKHPCTCGSKEFKPEQDVLDTWATSSLTPQLSIQLLKKKKNYKTLYPKLFPMSLRPQAHDIITFWLFNTVVKSRLHFNQNPWKEIMIAGHALDQHGKKMSKSKGNVIEPQEVLKKHGADALRFWASGCKLGDDLPYMEKDLITGKKMIIKLWNASQFCVMHLKGFSPKQFDTKKLKPMDCWLLSKLSRVVVEATNAFEEYEYARTRFCTEQFFWHDFCDFYLEIVKDRIYNPEKRGKDSQEAAKYSLYTGILTVLKLMAPIMPHITEAVYQEHFSKIEKCKSIHVSKWPVADQKSINETDEAVGDTIVNIIAAVRKAKSEKSKSLKVPVKQILIECPAEKQPLLETAFDDLRAACIAEKAAFGTGDREIEKGVKISVEF